MLHDLLQSRDLRSAVDWVLQHYRGELEQEPDILRALQGPDRETGAQEIAKFLSLFLLLVGDEPGARLAVSLSRPAATHVEICRLAGTPRECFAPEPLPPGLEHRHALEPLLVEWSETLLAWAARKRIPPMVARLEGGGVLGLSFVPVTAHGNTCLNLFVFNPNNPNKVRGLEDPEVIPVIGPRSFLACFEGVDEYPAGVLIGNHENFGHWLFNHLARLALAESVPGLADIPLVVGENVTATQLECLDLMGINESRIIRLRKGRLARFGTLWAPVMPFCSIDDRLFWNPGIVGFLRERLGVGRLPPAPGRKRRRLYLTRRASRWRRVLNEDAILDLLGTQGFEILDPGTLTIRQQLEIAADAEIILGAFGAGMNLLLFAPADAIVVELKHFPDIDMNINPALTRLIGQRYAGVMGTPRIDAAFHPTQYDFTVPPERIRDTLAATGLWH